MTRGDLPQLPTPWPTPVKVLFTDVDDTVTWEGRVPVEAFAALEQLRQSGIRVVPVTGGSAGWGDCIVRTWPVDTIIVENGGCWLEQDARGHVTRHFMETPDRRAADLSKLQDLGARFRAAYPDIDYADDQVFRITDIAFDIGQHAAIARDRAAAATQWWRDQGMFARFSSIHINVWAGQYDKAASALKWLAAKTDFTVEDCVFIGDSANDESMFAAFPHSVGVANVARHLHEMEHHPRCITASPGGYGFRELAASIMGGEG